jgi:hypothetical protein
MIAQVSGQLIEKLQALGAARNDSYCVFKLLCLLSGCIGMIASQSIIKSINHSVSADINMSQQLKATA